MRMYWFNFKENEHELRDEAPQDYSDYIPQDDAAQGLYRCYVALGDSPAQACIKVLDKCTGTKNDNHRS